jgi:capsular exopolysaccharide synthesis family protein
MKDLITVSNPNSAAAEAYRTLRTNLHFLGQEQPLRTLVLTAPDDDAASAEALANLALVCAQIDQRVIAVDANFRQPQLHARLGLSNSAGLAEALHDGAPQLQTTEHAGLRVLSAGSRQVVASDAVASLRMTSLLGALREQSDLVLINTASAASFTDAALISSGADGVLLVVTPGKTRRAALTAARESLVRARARILGALLV